MPSISTDDTIARLRAPHLHELEASAISPDVMTARGYTSITSPRALPAAFTRKQRMHHGLLIPIRDVTGDVVSYQLKPDEPYVDGTGRTVKYLTAADGRSCIDVPAAVLSLLRNPDVPLWITEGCKKVDSGLSNGIACIIGLIGVENWSSQGMALPDWKHIALRDRRVIVVFDSDVMVKASVRSALERFGSWLAMHKADVKYVIMPNLPDDGKCGLDDWFVSGGDVHGLEALTVDTLPGSVMDWEPPIPIGPFYGPPFPLDALSDWHRAFVEGIATSTQTPPDMAAWASIAAVGAATQGRFVVSPKADWKEPVHIQSLQVLASGGGKSPVYQHIMRPVHRIEAHWYQQWEVEHDRWELKKSALKSAERKASRDADKVHASPDIARALEAVQREVLECERAEPVLRRLTADDATAEALWHVLDKQGGAIAVMSPEGGFLANITGRYSDAPIFEPVLKGYSGDPHTIDRKTDNEHQRIPRAILALSISLQPKVIENMGAIPGFQTMGVSARLIMTFPQPITWPDLDAPPPEDEVCEWWETIINRVATETSGSIYSPNILALSPEAQRVFHAERVWWRDSTARGLFVDMDEWGRKYPGMVLRIAGLLHIFEEPKPQSVDIPGPVMERAIAIMRPAIEHARLGHTVMYGTDGQNAAQSVLEALIALRDDSGSSDGAIMSATVYDRLRGRQAFQKAESVIAALRFLEERRYVNLVRREGPGPQTFAVFLNPLYMPAKMRNFPISSPQRSETISISHLRRQSEIGQESNSESISHLRSYSKGTSKTNPLEPTGTDVWSMDL